MVVYLIHLDTPLAHANHYIGFSELTPLDRLQAHRTNRGAKMLAACNIKGITYRITRIWDNANRGFERTLKNRKKAAQLCPVCSVSPKVKKHLFTDHNL